ncbi:MAG TPA: hypothetical protein VFU86_08820 [Terriglobales bacterium]|nr:hypothetical protein [Terriglobales bacterium]
MGRRSRSSIVALCISMAISLHAQERVWHFAVSGDSRNCGDIVVPTIAADAAAKGAQFYWHLGDLRAIYDFDVDILKAKDRIGKPPLTISAYEQLAWSDSIQHQLAAFGDMPVFLGIGNHETIAPKDRTQFVIQFADWLDTPVLREQRLKDDPNDHVLKTYYHWIRDGIDFVYLDNTTGNEIDRLQLAWFERVIDGDAKDNTVKGIVVGMHAPLPDSLSYAHSMSDTPQGEQSGRRVYADLLKIRNGGKRVFVLASHSHFYMANIFNSEYWKAHGGVLPGWIVGTAGAFRYRLPPTASQADAALEDVYGYLLGTVHPDGSVEFAFQQMKRADVSPSVKDRYAPEVIDECFMGNSETQRQ